MFFRVSELCLGLRSTKYLLLEASKINSTLQRVFISEWSERRSSKSFFKPLPNNAKAIASNIEDFPEPVSP